MFGRIRNMLDRFDAIDANKLALDVFFIPDVKRFIIKLNLVDQLYEQGIDVNGKVIGTYSYTTALTKGEEHFIYNGLVSVKKFGEPYTLYDSGDFYETFKVERKGQAIIITANTVKDDKDLLDYGEILGLTSYSKDELSEKMLPYLQEALREYLLS